MTNMTKSPPFSLRIPIRFSHCDPAGYVFFPRFFEMIQAVSDHRSNRNDQIRTAVDVLGRSKDRLKVFKAIYRGKKALKTVPEIALGTGLSTYIPHISSGISAKRSSMSPSVAMGTPCMPAERSW